MSRTALVALAALAAVAAVPATAQDTAAPAPKKPAKEKKICRNQAPTGSRVPISTCHTASEWAAIDEQNAANAGNIRDSRGDTTVR